jgi:hypothetical protein
MKVFNMSAPDALVLIEERLASEEAGPDAEEAEGIMDPQDMKELDGRGFKAGTNGNGQMQDELHNREAAACDRGLQDYVAKQRQKLGMPSATASTKAAQAAREYWHAQARDAQITRAAAEAHMPTGATCVRSPLQGRWIATYRGAEKSVSWERRGSELACIIELAVWAWALHGQIGKPSATGAQDDFGEDQAAAAAADRVEVEDEGSQAATAAATASSQAKKKAHAAANKDAGKMARAAAQEAQRQEKVAAKAAREAKRQEIAAEKAKKQEIAAEKAKKQEIAAEKAKKQAAKAAAKAAAAKKKPAEKSSSGGSSSSSSGSSSSSSDSD